MRRSALMSAAACLLALAATPAQAQKVRGVTDNEIVVGMYTDLSGVAANWGLNNSNAWRLKFDEVNAAGGIHGRKIKLIIEDNQYQVPRSVQAANKLLNRDNVFMMVANAGTPMNNATLPEQIEKNVPNIFPLTSARSMYEPLHRLKFGLGSSYYDQMRAGVKYFVEQKGKKTLCAMYQDTDFGRDVMSGVWEQTKAMNIKLAAETAHKPTDTDFSAAVAKLRDAKCDLVLLGTIVRDTNQIIAAIRKIGWDVDILGQIATYDTAVAEAPGGVNEGLYTMTAILFAAPDDPREKVQSFVKKYKAAYNKDPNFAAQIGWSGAQVVIAALEKAGKDLTTESFLNALESIREFKDDFDSPPFTFGPDKHQGSNLSFLTQVQKGRFVRLGDAIGY